MVGGSANSLMGEIEKSEESEQYLISEFPKDVPVSSLFIPCPLKIKSRWQVVRSVLFCFKSLSHAKTLLKQKRREITISIGIYKYIPVFILLNALIFRLQIKFKIYCVPGNSYIDNLIVYLMRILRIKVVAQSRNISDLLEAQGVTVENIIGPIYWRSKFRYENLNVRNGQRILFVGNTKPQKGLRDLLQSMNGLGAEAVESLTLLTEEIDVSWKDEIDAFSRAQEYKVEHLEYAEDIQSIYLDNDVIVFPWKDTIGPSDYPIALLEAACFGLKCIVFEIGSALELATTLKGVYISNPSKLRCDVLQVLDEELVRKEVAMDNYQIIFGVKNEKP